MYHIYLLTNKNTGKRYVGYTSNFKTRWRTHIKMANSDAPTNKILYLSMRKHGVENFDFSLIYCSMGKSHTKNVMEPYFIKEYGTLAPFGYNMTSSGDGGPGVTSEKASELNTARVKSGTHVFLSENFREATSRRMKASNPMKRPNVRKRQAESSSRAMKAKVAAGTHYFQSEASRTEKRIRMATMSNRPIISEVRALYRTLGVTPPRGIHSSSTEKLVARKIELEQKIARIQFSNLDFSST